MALNFSAFKLFISLINSKIILSHSITNFILLYFKPLNFSYKLENNTESLLLNKKTKNHKNEKIHTFKYSSIDTSEFSQNEK